MSLHLPASSNTYIHTYIHTYNRHLNPEKNLKLARLWGRVPNKMGNFEYYFTIIFKTARVAKKQFKDNNTLSLNLA